MTTSHVHDQQLGGSPSTTLEVRRLSRDDMAYAVSTMRESHRASNSNFVRLPWSIYKQTTGKKIHDLLNSDTVTLIGAFDAQNRIVGWLGFTPGRSISTVHYTYTRRPERRRGVMEMLINAAELGRRFAYTHRGVRDIVHHGSRDRSPDATRHVTKGPTLDLAIVKWLAGRGQTATFVELEEWLR